METEKHDQKLLQETLEKEYQEFSELFKKHMALSNTFLFIVIEEYANKKVLKTKPNEYRQINYRNAIRYFRQEIEELYEKSMKVENNPDK